MYCTACGAQLDPGWKFCMSCGTPVATGTAAPQPIVPVQPTSEPIWETCEIYTERTKTWIPDQYWFVAKAIGPLGTYDAAHSKSFFGKADTVRPQDRNFMNGLHDELVRELMNGRWEPVEPRGREWYSLRFRRRIR